MDSFSKNAKYGLIGLSDKNIWDDQLGLSICRKLEPTEKECILANALSGGESEEPLIAAAAEFFGNDQIFYRDQQGMLGKTFFYQHFDVSKEVG